MSIRNDTGNSKKQNKTSKFTDKFEFKKLREDLNHSSVFSEHDEAKFVFNNLY